VKTANKTAVLISQSFRYYDPSDSRMRISNRTKSMAFFIALGVCLVTLTVVVNVSWIMLNWRRVVPLVIGVVFFFLIIAGLSVNTVFLVREIRRNEQQDSFLNAVTHELKTPIASIRLYLETLQSRQLDEAQRREFYRIMLCDTDRLLGTVEQVPEDLDELLAIGRHAISHHGRIVPRLPQCRQGGPRLAAFTVCFAEFGEGLAAKWRDDVKELADLKPGMTLEGVVTNVTRFGAFVDLGVHHDGLVHVTRDGGKSWTNVTPKDMPDLGRVSQIDASIFDAGSAYVSVKKPLLEDFSPYIFRTHDFGRTWTKIVTGIAPNDYVSSVREDPVRKGLLYAGAQHGFYVSLDDGDHWQLLSSGLPDTQVSDIWVEGNDLAIATHGRSFYVLDDVNPLRQYNASVTSTSDAHLFKPGDAIRGGSPARFTYWLKQPAQNLKLEILDSRGQVMRSFDGALPNAGRGRGRGDAAAGQAPSTTPGQAQSAVSGQSPEGRGGNEGTASGEDEEGGGRGRGGPPPAMTAGVQRFAWDLQSTPVVSFQGMVLWGATTNGPTALPGAYQARLTVDGRALTQPITVRKHPFFSASDADIREQF
jgi:hypothetical protein